MSSQVDRYVAASPAQRKADVRKYSARGATFAGVGIIALITSAVASSTFFIIVTACSSLPLEHGMATKS